MLHVAQPWKRNMCGSNPNVLICSLFEYALPRCDCLLAIDVKVDCDVRIGHLCCFGVNNIAP
ncbi:hypothetical protein D3C80_1063740 [compost metagenome]